MQLLSTSRNAWTFPVAAAELLIWPNFLFLKQGEARNTPVELYPMLSCNTIEAWSQLLFISHL